MLALRVLPTGLTAACLMSAGAGLLPATAPAARADDGLLTVAETSDFRATARYAEVVALCERLAAASPLVNLASLGKSVEGRDIPLLLIADPPVSEPTTHVVGVVSAPTTRALDDRLLVLAIGNIHAGEVDGKEALPMLAREIVAASRPAAPHPLLKDLILAFAPIYNADGNERVARDNRPGQVGPEEGMGRRENADGLDLNRDFIKLEAPETRGLVDFLNRWDPAIFIDCHTTNGSYHRYIITYDGPKNPAGDPAIIRFCRDEMMPAIARDCETKYGVPCFVYGDFNHDHTRWETYPAHARYGTTYVGLRNRISILSEGYSYAPYRARVLGTRDFVKACLEYVAANKSRIRALLAEADARQSEPPTPARTSSPSSAPILPLRPAEGTVALRTKAVAAPQKVVARGFVEEQRDGRAVSTGIPRDYDVELWTHFEPTLTVARPRAYLVPADRPTVLEKLRQHGIEVAPLTQDQEMPVDVYRIDKVAYAEAPFQKHKTVKVEATPRRETRTIPAGTLLVPTAQKLGALAAYLLEPQSEDGLLTWNFFDDALTIGSDHPILRVP